MSQDAQGAQRIWKMLTNFGVKTAPPCPLCGSPSVELFESDAPNIGYFGMFRCLRDECSHLFDPKLPEV